MNALTNEDVGKYLNRHFVSAFQRVGTFQINEWGQKQGGNVAGYFCTADGLVLHAIAGPVNAKRFLREAMWVNQTFQFAQLNETDRNNLPAYFRDAHIKRLRQEYRLIVPKDRLPRPNAFSKETLKKVLQENLHLAQSNQAKVHLLLAVAPAPKLREIYQLVFERILNEKVSTNPVNVAGK